MPEQRTLTKLRAFLDFAIDWWAGPGPPLDASDPQRLADGERLAEFTSYAAEIMNELNRAERRRARSVGAKEARLQYAEIRRTLLEVLDRGCTGLVASLDGARTAAEDLLESARDFSANAEAAISLARQLRPPVTRTIEVAENARTMVQHAIARYMRRQ